MPPQPASVDVVPRLGISSCLLGEEVRYNGGHMKDDFLLNTLGRFVEWVMVCPEVELGLGTPRESLRLVGAPSGPRLVAPKSGTDYTVSMRAWAKGRLVELEQDDLDGYVLKKESPSCGLMRVKVYDKNKMPARTGVGAYAQALVDHYPLLPIEEEGRLRDPTLRENFIERVFAYHRWKRVVAANRTPAGLIAFHTAHKLTLMSHGPQAQTELGRIVAAPDKRRIDATFEKYATLFMEVLSMRATRRKHTNTLQHLAGYLKRELDKDDKEELQQSLDQYRGGLVPLIVPITLFRHHIRRCDVPDWVHAQVYLNPYPHELMLRNDV